jgi:hypothetical protein
MPPLKYIRIDLLILYPLLPRVLKTEITGLCPRREMINLIPLGVIEEIEGALSYEITLFRTHGGDLMARATKVLHEMCPQKASGARNEYLHIYSLGLTGKKKLTP